MSLGWRSLEEARELGFARQNLAIYETALEQIAREPIMDSVTAIRMRAAAVDGAAVPERAGVLAEHAGRHEFAAGADLLHVLRCFGSHPLRVCRGVLAQEGVNGSPGLQFASASMRADAMSIDPA